MEVTRLGDQPDGAAPLTAEDLDGLKASWVSTLAELNQATSCAGTHLGLACPATAVLGQAPPRA